MAESLAPINERIAAAWPDILQSIADGNRVDLTCQRLGFERNQLWRFWSRHPQRRTEWYDAHKDSADAIIDNTHDVDILKRWLSTENRATTRRDLTRRIKDLGGSV